MDPVAAVRRLNELSKQLDQPNTFPEDGDFIAQEMAQIWDGLYEWLAKGGTIPAEAFQ